MAVEGNRKHDRAEYGLGVPSNRGHLHAGTEAQQRPPMGAV